MKNNYGFLKTHVKVMALQFACVLGIICSLLYTLPSSAQESVKVSYGEVTIPTYPWRGKDDINPSFRSTSNPMYSPYTTTYPYPTQDNLSKTKVDMTYKTMILENEYLKVVVIPDLGGHVQAVYDKLTGESIVYDNKVVKPTLIGLRGAWTSGGIEFNTGPQGHTVTCLSPVEATFINYDDGSKGIAIGNVEQVYHTQWVATIRLRPGKDYMEEHIRIYNPTEIKRLYYFWNCVAVVNTDSLQFIYPMTLGQDHAGKTFFNWPVDKGKDISRLKNYDLPSGIFSYRCDQNFYGSYDHALDKGLLTYADHNELEGKKSWTWGKGTWGARFQACLRDDSTCYNEIQTGPLPTQSDYGTLYPHQTVEWNEWWYPVRGTKGVTFSDKDVTVNVLKDEKKHSLIVLMNGTSKYQATCSVAGCGEQQITLSPEKAAAATFTCKNMADTFHIIINTSSGKLADFTYPLTIPLRTPPEKPRELPSDNTAAGCWLRGIQNEKEGGDHLSRDWFQKAIQKDENFTPAMTALAEIEVNAGEFEAAKKHLERSVKLNPDDGWGLYYLAKADLQLGFTADAMEMAYHAARCVESASAGYSLAGAIYLRQGNFADAIAPFREAVDYNGQDLVSRDLLAYALWKTGKNDAALHELAEVQKRDALDMPSGVIMHLMGKDDKEFTARVLGHTEEVLDMADFFLTAGLRQDAITVLKEYYINDEYFVDGVKQERAPMPYYYYGILANDEEVLKKGMSMSPDYVFPNSLPCMQILQEAVKLHPKDWKAHYYLGNFLFEHGRTTDAVKQWNDALAINDSYSVLHRNLGMVSWKVDKNYWQAIAHYEKAIKCNSSDIPLYHDLGSIYVDNTQQYGRAITLLEPLVLVKKCNRADIISLLTRAYDFMGEYDKTIAMLSNDTYMNWEGRGSIYTIYTEAHLGKGEQLFNQGNYEGAYKEFQKSIEYPMTLGPGLTTDPETARSRYWIGLSLEKLGKKEEAAKQWKLAAEETEKGSDENKKFAKDAKEKVASMN